MGTQLRLTGRGVLGFDMTAMLAIAQASGIQPGAVTALLPTIEAVMVRKINEQIRTE